MWYTEMTKYLKAKEVAGLLSVNPRFVYSHARELNGAKIGGTWFFTSGGWMTPHAGKTESVDQ